MLSFLTGIKILDIAKIVAVIAVLIAVGGAVYAGYRHVTNLQEQVTALSSENATLTANNAQLQRGIFEQQRAIASLQESYELQASILRNTYRDFQDARDQVTDLETKLSKHELGYLASQKPKLVENIIDRASDNINRCFEIASGSPLTEAEKNATLPSEINGECPEIANPKYKAQP